MTKEVIYSIIVLIALLINGVMDLKERNVDSIFFLVAAVAGLFLSGRPILCGITIASCLFVDRIPKIPVGAGDIDAILLIVTALGEDSVIALLIGCVSAIVYCLIKRQKTNVPFVFCLLLGFAVYMTIYFISPNVLPL